ncbi:MAG: hypothetical protein ACFFED_12815 [Candidatus Thorarchaeota archaeon]
MTTETEKSPIVEDKGAFFFNPPSSLWPLLSALLAIVLFSAWSTRSGLDFVVSIIVIAVYSILALWSTRFNYGRLVITEDGTHLLLEFKKPGFSWKYLFYSLLGSAIPILLPWFVLANSVTETPEITQSIMIIAMVLYVLIIPVLPSLANIPNLSILKTKLHSSYDLESQKIDDFDLQIHELDRFWYSFREDEEVIQQVRNTLLKMFQEHLEVNSS